MKILPPQAKLPKLLLALGWILLSAAIYYFAAPQKISPFDYTLRVAQALLNGQLGLTETPPSWLNEFVPHQERFYAVFPLGAVLSMLPLALVTELHLSALLAALQGAALAAFALLITRHYGFSPAKQALLSAMLLFGNWFWVNLAFGGAWQLALGFSLVGQMGLLYFLWCRPRPLLAGAFFALAFGNRTELLIIAPLLLFLLLRRTEIPLNSRATARAAGALAFFPFLLLTATLWYNFARFGSAWDFGYARIPGVLTEPWYQQGIFSLSAIPWNFREMLLTPWKPVAGFPYFTPTGFGGSIIMSCPFVLLLFHRRGDRYLKITAWLAIIVLTAVLWCHGNPGGWQYSYRYATILLPWFFLLLLEGRPNKITASELLLTAAAILINTWGLYLWLWSPYMSV